MNRGFWRGRRVLVTGHTGFKGSWLSLWLAEAGADVCGFALEPPSEPSLFDRARVGEVLRDVRGDVRDLDALRRAFADHQPEIVLHLAAQSLVRASYQDPLGTYSTNVMGTANVLELVRGADGVHAVVIVTSDKCYENREWIWGYREDDAMGGHDPYSSSKGCAELVAAAFRRSFFPPADHARHGVGIASARAGNVIGGGDWATDRLVPDVVRAFATGREVVLRNPRATRPWQHVLEPLDGYLLLAEKLVTEGATFADGWNFGPREEAALPVGAVVEKLARLWGHGARWVVDPAAQPHEAHQLRLDCAKAHLRLGWRARLELDDALRWIVEWHVAAHRGEDARALTQRDISRYEALSS